MPFRPILVGVRRNRRSYNNRYLSKDASDLLSGKYWNSPESLWLSLGRYELVARDSSLPV